MWEEANGYLGTEKLLQFCKDLVLLIPGSLQHPKCLAFGGGGSQQSVDGWVEVGEVGSEVSDFGSMRYPFRYRYCVLHCDQSSSLRKFLKLANV